MPESATVKIYNGAELKAIIEKDPVLKATLQLAMTTTVQQAIDEVTNRLQPYAQAWAAYMNQLHVEAIDILPISLASIKREDQLNWRVDERGGMRIAVKWSGKKIIVPGRG